MIKKVNLQMFADEGAAATAEKTDAKATETKTEEKAAEKSEAKYTDADLDRIIGQKFAKWQKDEQKKVDEAKKLAEMNATQKAEYERDQLQKELDSYKKKDALASMTKEARKMLADENISVPDEMLAMLVNTNADETKAAVTGFAKVFKDAVEAAVKERLKGDTPKKGTTGATTMTKAQIMAIADPELRQKKMLEHRELFNF